jgi:hypothetical protein
MANVLHRLAPPSPCASSKHRRGRPQRVVLRGPWRRLGRWRLPVPKPAGGSSRRAKPREVELLRSDRGLIRWVMRIHVPAY